MVENCDKLNWVRSLRAGDAGACKHLYSFLRERILPRLPLAPGVDREDVVADTASAVWQSLRSLRDDSKFFSFAATIARRVAWRRQRECKRSGLLPTNSPARAEESVGQDNVERDELLNGLFGVLRKGDRQLFRLLYVVGAGASEVQETLNVSPEILRKRRHRLNLKLRQAARDHAAGPARD